VSLCIAGILTHQSNRCAPAVFLKAHHSSDPLGPTQLLNSETLSPMPDCGALGCLRTNRQRAT